MTFPTDDIFLTHSYGKRKGTEMIVFHTTEGSGPSRDAALATAKMQAPGGSLYAGGGSYNFIIYDGGVLLTVPYLEIAGSLSTDHRPPPLAHWQPKDWVKGFLSAQAQADTNAYIVAICFSGRAADLAAGKYPANMIDTAAKLVRWVEQQDWAPDNIPLAGHADFQTNRTDPGAGVVDRILARYNELYAPPAPAPAPKPVPLPDTSTAVDWAGKKTAFGTHFPVYVHTDAEALAWYDRTVRALVAAGKISP